MTAEEFVRKYGVGGGAEWLEDDQWTVGPSRTYGLTLTMRGGTWKTAQTFSGNYAKTVPPLSAVQYVYILAACCHPGPQQGEFSWLHGVTWTADWDDDDTTAVRRWMNDAAVWADFLAITSES